MAKLFKSSKPAPVTQTSSVSLPSWMSGQMEANSNQAASLAQSPFQAWSGSSFTDLTPQQQQAMGITAGVAQSTPQQVGVSGGPMSVQAGSAVNQLGGIDNLGIAGADLSGYQDPYTAQVIDATNTEIDRNTVKAQQDAAGKAALAGAFGGDRAAIQDAEIAGQGIRTKAQVGSQLRSQGFQRSQDLAEADIGRALGAVQQDNTLDLQGQIANQGTLANWQNLDLQAQQANQSAGIADQQLDLAAGQQLFQQGETQREAQEAGRTFDYGEFLRQINDPYNKLQWSQGITTGAAPYFATQTTTSNAPGPSPFGQILGGATAGAGLLGLFRGKAGGGIVDFADGGEVDDDGWEPPPEPGMLTPDLRHLSREAQEAVRAIYPSQGAPQATRTAASSANTAMAQRLEAERRQQQRTPAPGVFVPSQQPRLPEGQMVGPALPPVPMQASAFGSNAPPGLEGRINDPWQESELGTSGEGTDPYATRGAISPPEGIGAAVQQNDAFRAGERQGIAEAAAAEQTRKPPPAPPEPSSAVQRRLAELRSQRGDVMEDPGKPPPLAPAPPGATSAMGATTTSRATASRAAAGDANPEGASSIPRGTSEQEAAWSQAERELGVPARILRAQSWHESRHNPRATGQAGEWGAAQVLPSTARNPGYGVAPITEEEARDRAKAALWQARYLAARARSAGVQDWSDPEQAARGLAAYNGTGGAARQYGATVARLAGLPVQDGGRPRMTIDGTAEEVRPSGIAAAAAPQGQGQGQGQDPPGQGIAAAATPDEGDFFSRLSNRLSDPKRQGSLALLQAGAAMMASRNPHWMGAIGEGIAAGTKAAQHGSDLAERREDRKEARADRRAAASATTADREARRAEEKRWHDLQDAQRRETAARLSAEAAERAGRQEETMQFRREQQQALEQQRRIQEDMQRERIEATKREEQRRRDEDGRREEDRRRQEDNRQRDDRRADAEGQQRDDDRREQRVLSYERNQISARSRAAGTDPNTFTANPINRDALDRDVAVYRAEHHPRSPQAQAWADGIMGAERDRFARVPSGTTPRQFEDGLRAAGVPEARRRELALAYSVRLANAGTR